MNSQEIEVVMESCENSSDFVPYKVTASWSEFVRSMIHHFSESLTRKSHSDSSHLSNSIATINHVVSPVVASHLPLWEIFRHLVLCDILFYISDVPKVSPLGIMRRRLGSVCLVITFVALCHLLESSGSLSVLRSSSHLETFLREYISNRLIGIEILRSSVEEVLKHIQKLVVLISIDSRIFNNEAAIMFKSFCHSFTVLSVVTRFGEEGLDIHDRDRDGRAKQSVDPL